VPAYCLVSSAEVREINSPLLSLLTETEGNDMFFGVVLLLAAVMAPFDGAGWGAAAACFFVGLFCAGACAGNGKTPAPRNHRRHCMCFQCEYGPRSRRMR